ncbi:hypothetical protein ACIFUY_06470 [Streptomyces sp. CACIS-1.16CA]|uniref:hypothetical protein n=1 Tax=Streptomyces sp. CACIS-1.16CA TaxID=1175510 RepID=UPI0037D592BE
MSARDDLTAYATTTHTITADSIAPRIDAVEAETTASTRAALSDRAAENRELRRDAGRAADLIEKGETAQALSLLRRLARSTT